jgi:hypothetical protein
MPTQRCRSATHAIDDLPRGDDSQLSFAICMLKQDEVSECVICEDGWIKSARGGVRRLMINNWLPRHWFRLMQGTVIAHHIRYDARCMPLGPSRLVISRSHPGQDFSAKQCIPNASIRRRHLRIDASPCSFKPTPGKPQVKRCACSAPPRGYITRYLTRRAVRYGTVRCCTELTPPGRNRDGRRSAFFSFFFTISL